MANKAKVYTCEICHATNHVAKFACSNCGTVPAMYSGLHKPMRRDAAITVCVAFGAERVDTFRHSRAYLRTVPMDYYAEGK